MISIHHPHYKHTWNKKLVPSIIRIIFITLFLIMSVQAVRYYKRIVYYQWRDANVYASPCPNFCNYAGQIYAAEYKPTVDDLVDKYADKYGKNNYLKNRTKAMIHYLLLRESNYAGTQKCGDSGKACGPLQFWADTYKGYRKIMMVKGLVDHMGSRLDMEDAIETTAWAINDGRENAWGPVARGEGF